VGLTAGTSTPDDVVDRIESRIRVMTRINEPDVIAANAADQRREIS
jgi:4-hydroxy-3-methylbut-2-enyl diphosphate reductase IspH